MSIETVAVIGAGVMGAGIAAQITNAGIPVKLLDIVPDAAKNRNIITETAIAKLLKSQPEAFMHKKNARLMTPGNIEDDLQSLKDVDWVIEAVLENPKIKKSLYLQLHDICPAETLISSNTSTLPLSLLLHGMPDEFRRRFMITHFFNPPRYMRLLELVSDAQTDPGLIKTVKEFADVRLGKGCVSSHDTPGFIGNRIGIYWLQCAMLEAMQKQISIEAADAVISAVMQVPKTGIFGLLDLVGLDLIPHILAGMKMALPETDAFHQVNQLPDLLQRMIDDGYTGRKGKGGFYRLNKTDGKKIKEAINLQSGDYAASEKPSLDFLKSVSKTGAQGLLSIDDPCAEFSWQVLSKTLTYATSLVPEIADDILAVDEAMRLGYNWKKGPFELLDEIGVDWFVDQLEAENRVVPTILSTRQPLYKVTSGKAVFQTVSGSYETITRAPGVLLLSDIKSHSTPILNNASASLWDIGEGIACLEFHSKMNTLDMDIMDLTRQSIEKVSNEYKALVIHNEGENFSAGANLGLLLEAIHTRNWPAVENLITFGQQTYQALKYAPFPVVAAPSGLALGGGCEILLHCDSVQAHAELYTGLVEVGVGLIPGWGGCKEYLARQFQQQRRFGGPVPPISKAFETISMAKISKSAFDAQQLLFLSPDDGITMNKDRLLADARSKALALSVDYSVPEPYEFHLPGKSVKVLFFIAIKSFRLLGKATTYDTVIAQQLAEVLSGDGADITEAVSEDEMLALELQGFLNLVKQSGTFARLEHMLKTGKPLRN